MHALHFHLWALSFCFDGWRLSIEVYLITSPPPSTEDCSRTFLSQTPNSMHMTMMILHLEIKNLCLSCVNFHRYTLSNVKGDLKRKILKKTKTIDTSKVHCEVHRGIIHIAVIQRRVKLICKIGKSISKWNKTKIIFTIFKFKNTVSHLIADIEIKTSEKKENMERNGGKLFEAPSRRPSPLLLSTSLGAPCVLLPIIPIFEPIFLQRSQSNIYWYQSSKRC